MNQKYTSERTSINSTKIPAIFKLAKLNPNTINLDYGGGKFDIATDYLKEFDIENLIYDPFNRTGTHNENVLNRIKENNGADSKHGLTWGVGGHGDWIWMEFYKDGEFMTSEMFDSLNLIKNPPKEFPINEEIDYCPFGWLSPLGDFIESDFGEHEESAREIIDNNAWEDDFYNWKKSKQEYGLLARDYLCEVKGYALLHNPIMGGVGKTMITHIKQLTPKQEKYLLSYNLLIK